MTFEPGTKRWWRGESLYGARGVVESILQLVSQGSISQRKAVELIAYAHCYPIRSDEEPPKAPWGELQWGSNEKEKP